MSRTPSFGSLTEGPGGKVSREGADMLASRYGYAAGRAAGRRVLEVGCGPGVGLGLLAEGAEGVVGGDFDGGLLSVARATWGDEIPLVRLDVQSLPFASGAFDAALFFEGSYYVPDAGRAFAELRRILRPGGELVFVNANPERADFIPSPLSTHYHSADEFREALEGLGFRVRVEGAFPVEAGGPAARAVILLRRLLRRFGLVPSTLAGRALLKRWIYGRLLDVPGRLPPDFGRQAERRPLPAGPARDVKVLYVTATREA